MEFPQDESIESFDVGFVPQIYIWEDTSKPFSVALGDGLIIDLKWEVEFNINCPCFLSWGNLSCGREHDLYSFYNIVINRLYQIEAITEEKGLCQFFEVHPPKLDKKLLGYTSF